MSQHRYVVKTGPDRWQIDMNDGKGGFKSGWIDFWIVEAIAQAIRQIDNISKHVRVELVVDIEDEAEAPDPFESVTP